MSRTGGFKKGAIVAEVYRVDEKVGEGAFGEVWCGTVVATGERVALKKLHASVAATGDMLKRFRREAYFLSRVQSNYVAKVKNFVFDANSGMVLVLEYIDGASLADLYNQQVISVEVAIDIAVDILHGLKDLHTARIIHRDLKPANVIMQPQLNGARAVLCDFGMSRLLAPPAEPKTPSSRPLAPQSLMTQLTPSNVTLGTLEYVAPEQILNSREASERSDIYSLGALIYRGVTGVHPFEAAGARSMAQLKLMEEAPPLNLDRTDSLAKAFEAAIDHALRRRPRDRYQSADEMLEEMLRLQELARGSSEVETITNPAWNAGKLADDPTVETSPEKRAPRSVKRWPQVRSISPMPAAVITEKPVLVAKGPYVPKTVPMMPAVTLPSAAAQPVAPVPAPAVTTLASERALETGPPAPSPIHASAFANAPKENPPVVAATPLPQHSPSTPPPPMRASSPSHPPSPPPPSPMAAPVPRERSESSRSAGRVSPLTLAATVGVVFVLGIGVGRLFMTRSPGSDAPPAPVSAPPVARETAPPAASTPSAPVATESAPVPAVPASTSATLKPVESASATPTSTTTPTSTPSSTARPRSTQATDPYE